MVDDLLLRAVVADRQRWAAQQRLVRAARMCRVYVGQQGGSAGRPDGSVWDAALSSFARAAATT